MLPPILKHLVATLLASVLAVGRRIARLPAALVVEMRCARRIDASVQAADAVWPLAPQAGGQLERLSRQVLGHRRILLGSKPGALRVAASRLRTSRMRARAGIAVVPT